MSRTTRKDQVLEAYLNLVAFGPSTYGAEAAAEHFFGVSADKLSLAQAALLAAMVNNPNKYNPLVPSQSDVTKDRRDLVLDDMARDGWISKTTAEKTKKEGLGVTATPTANGCIDAPNSATNGYFCRYVLDYLANVGFDYADIQTGGYTITTTLDPTVMAAAVAGVRKNADPSDAQAKRVANVTAVVEPGVTTRKVLALAANRPYGLDQAKGQTVQKLTTTFAPLGAGSTFKIFTTAAVMSLGLGVNATVDVPKTYVSPLAPSHTFHNEGDFAPTMPISQALAESPNTTFVSLEDQVGLSKVVDMSVKLGLRGYNLDAGDVDPAFAGTGNSYADEVTAQKIASYTLGVSPVSPLELSNVGATLDSDGLWCPPTPVDSIADRNGNQVTWKQQPCEQAVPPELARTLTNAIYGDMHDSDGTAYKAAQAAKWTRASASKTGTTQDYKSSAFLGYTPYYSAAVVTWDYLNRPQPICKSPLRTCTEAQAQGGAGMSGGSVPAQTWLSVMTPLHQGKSDTPFPVSSPEYLVGPAHLPDPERDQPVIGRCQAAVDRPRLHRSGQQRHLIRQVRSRAEHRGRPEPEVGRPARHADQPGRVHRAGVLRRRLNRRIRPGVPDEPTGPATSVGPATRPRLAAGGRRSSRCRNRRVGLVHRDRAELVRPAPGRAAGARAGALADPGAAPLRPAHRSPASAARRTGCGALADLRPDLVVNTGDTLSGAGRSRRRWPRLGALLDLPGAFVFGNNDFYAPVPKSPHRYFTQLDAAWRGAARCRGRTCAPPRSSAAGST